MLKQIQMTKIKIIKMKEKGNQLMGMKKNEDEEEKK